MCDFDDNFYEYYRSNKLNAICSIKCFECNEEIKKGEEFIYSQGWSSDTEGKDEFETCIECFVLQNFLSNEFDCPTMHGGLYECLDDHLDDLENEERKELIFSGPQKLQEIYSEFLEDLLHDALDEYFEENLFCLGA